MFGSKLFPLWVVVATMAILISGALGAPAKGLCLDCGAANSTVSTVVTSTMTVNAISLLALCWTCARSPFWGPFCWGHSWSLSTSETRVASQLLTDHSLASSQTSVVVTTATMITDPIISGSPVPTSANASVSQTGVSTVTISSSNTGNIVRTSLAPTAPFVNGTSIVETVTTIVTTSYTEVCPTGFTVRSTTFTAAVCPKATAAITGTGGSPCAPTIPPIPSGWTTTVTVCTVCAPTPTTVTLTVPCATSPATATPVITVVTCTESCSKTMTEITTPVPTPVTTVVTCTENCFHTITQSPTSGASSAPLTTILIPCTKDCSKTTTFIPAATPRTVTNVTPCTSNCWNTITLGTGQASAKPTVTSKPFSTSGVVASSPPSYNAGSSLSGVSNIFSTSIIMLLALLV
ncbi:hypothetical protein N7468_008306 [Penicillium chermesinum]|uniref:Uncharacterized protein n=1 Tax=Penicillium chermesinum TaxID=63820 RepID=A0A9W9NSD0_9EURO|nr:uncharacterized protein N7468_008306 [Penicillium chermesinum]KAJ5223764.1 hypothetical protein N7468_008306 [Penicillium chermesinum]KAJ6155409.1 hypothetical protein N7470_005975 [Penicillium chermesinum]